MTGAALFEASRVAARMVDRKRQRMAHYLAMASMAMAEEMFGFPVRVVPRERGESIEIPRLRWRSEGTMEHQVGEKTVTFLRLKKVVLPIEDRR